MSTQDDEFTIIERFLTGRASDDDISTLTGLLRKEGSGPISVGKYLVNLESASDVHIGDRTYIGPDAERLRALLSEMQQTKARAQRDDHIFKYLRALRTASDRLPYAHLGLPGTISLTKLYVEPTLIKREPETPSLLSTRGAPIADTGSGTRPHSTSRRNQRLTAWAALANNRHAIIEGGPGAGKSSLFCRVAATLAGDYLRGSQRALVPVRVSAPLLALHKGSFADCLRVAAEAEVGRNLGEALPRRLFAQRPNPNASWIIFVDSLEAIQDSRTRMEILRDLAHTAADTASPYLFWVASRHLAEFEGLLPHADVYDIAPFAPLDVELFARQWCSSIPGARRQDAGRLLDHLRQAELLDVGRVPLLLTLAAVLFSREPTQPLPSTRAGLYKMFVAGVLDENRKRNDSTVLPGAEGRGSNPPTMFGDLVAHQLRILEHLAVWRYEGGQGPLASEAFSFASVQGWLSVDADVAALEASVAGVLLETGFVCEADEDLAFTHDSFRDYFCASAYARVLENPDGSRARKMLGRWNEPDSEEVLLFLLGIWSEAGRDITAALSRIWPSGRLRRLTLTGRARKDVPEDARLRFVARVLQDGASAKPRLRKRLLLALLEHPIWRDSYGLIPFRVGTGMSRESFLRSEVDYGISLATAGDYESANAAFVVVLESGMSSLVAWAEFGLGIAAELQGNMVAARMFFEQSLLAKDLSASACAAHELGLIELLDMNFDRAQELFEESLSYYYRPLRPATWVALGAMCSLQGDLIGARDHLVRALNTGGQHIVGAAALTLAGAIISAGYVSDEVRELIRVADAHGQPRVRDASRLMSGILAIDDDPSLSIKIVREVMHSSQPVLSAMAKSVLASVLLTEPNGREEATKLLYEVSRSGHRLLADIAAFTLGEALLDVGDAGRAKEFLREAARSRDGQLALEAALALGKVLEEEGEWIQGHRILTDLLAHFEDEPIGNAIPVYREYVELRERALSFIDDRDVDRRNLYSNQGPLEVLLGLAADLALEE